MEMKPEKMLKRAVAFFKQEGVVRTGCRIFTEPICALLEPLIKKCYIDRGKVNQNLVGFYSRPTFSDNGEVFYHYLLERPEYQRMKFIWFLDDERGQMPDGERTKTVQLKSRFHHGYTYAARRQMRQCGFLFSTHVLYAERIPGQRIVYLWHGCSYKKADETFLAKHLCADALLVPGPLFVRTKSESWRIPAEILLPLGYPRYDLLNQDSQKAEKFARKIGKGNRLVIWLPTFRNPADKRSKLPELALENTGELPLIHGEQQLRWLDHCCEELGITLCIKRHHYQSVWAHEEETLSNIRFLKDEDFFREGVALYSFLRYTDALITDYSSVAVDYLLLDRPIAFTLDDLQVYQKYRGLVFDDPENYMPGDHLYLPENLKSYLENISLGKDEHAKDRQRMKEIMHNPCDHYCARIAERCIDSFLRA